MKMFSCVIRRAAARTPSATLTRGLVRENHMLSSATPRGFGSSLTTSKKPFVFSSLKIGQWRAIPRLTFSTSTTNHSTGEDALDSLARSAEDEIVRFGGVPINTVSHTEPTESEQLSTSGGASTTTTTGSETSTTTTSDDSKAKGESNEDDEGPPKLEEITDDDLKLSHEQFINMTPKEVISELNRFVVGQDQAKKAMAVALRNRWRRQQLPEAMREDVVPKNILMIGPTGCGKTEIARRISKLSNAPFVKVEATKYTEVGFHGRDVDMIIRDLVEAAISTLKENRKKKVQSKIAIMVEDFVLTKLIGTAATKREFEEWRVRLRAGQLESNSIQFELPSGGEQGEGDDNRYQDLMAAIKRMATGSNQRGKNKTMSIAEARPLIKSMLEDQLVTSEDLNKEAIKLAEQTGIVVIDEIDKICTASDGYRSADASAEGVQRDLLPLIEGCITHTKYGNVRTDHILFVAAGAFHRVKPSDLLPELQGRLPIRVQLEALDEAALYKVLTEPEHSLIKQQIALLATEGVSVEFTEGALREIAKVAAEVNTVVENIGARRLQTIVERVMEDISFNAPELAGQTRKVTSQDVRSKVGDLLKTSDKSKFVL